MGMENTEKKKLFEHVTQLENRLGEIYAELESIKEHIAHLVEDHHHLFLENERLRNRLVELVADQNLADNDSENLRPQASGKHPVGEGYDNLARLYKEGFHICHPHFGSLRTEDHCLFCLSILRKRES